jgi:hypothetical protein
VRAAFVLVATLALLAAAPAAAATAKIKLTTSSATPVVDQPWRYTVTVRSATGVPLRARVKLQLLLSETVVGCFTDGAMTQCFGKTAGDWITFRGKRAGILRFPVQSVGVKLTFQAIVVVHGQTRKLRAPVTVRPA